MVYGKIKNTFGSLKMLKWLHHFIVSGWTIQVYLAQLLSCFNYSSKEWRNVLFYHIVQNIAQYRNAAKNGNIHQQWFSKSFLINLAFPFFIDIICIFEVSCSFYWTTAGFRKMVSSGSLHSFNAQYQASSTQVAKNRLYMYTNSDFRKVLMLCESPLLIDLIPW